MKKRKKKKSKASIPASAPEKRLAHLDAVAPFKTCYICERESRSAMMVGLTHYRCDNCYPTSYNWIQFWKARPKHKQPESVQFLLKYCEV